MSTITKPTSPETDARVQAVFDDIRQTRNTQFIGNIWRYLAFDPSLLNGMQVPVDAEFDKNDTH